MCGKLDLLPVSTCNHLTYSVVARPIPRLEPAITHLAVERRFEGDALECVWPTFRAHVRQGSGEIHHDTPSPDGAPCVSFDSCVRAARAARPPSCTHAKPHTDVTPTSLGRTAAAAFLGRKIVIDTSSNPYRAHIHTHEQTHTAVACDRTTYSFVRGCLAVRCFRCVATVSRRELCGIAFVPSPHVCVRVVFCISFPIVDASQW